MYCVGGVDLQDVCASYLREKNLYNSLDKISLSNAVKLTLGIELDKEYQLYPWINRPIDCKAMKYATTDSKVLLMLWNYLKSNIDINKISLNRSKEVMLIKYQFPVRKNCWIGDLANFMTHMKCGSASIKSVIIDELNERKELFRLLWLTRDECSRSVDRRSNIFMSVDQLGCIFRFQPQTVESLLSLLPNLRQWDILISQKIISCILEFKNIVEERKIVEKRLPSATVTSNMEVEDEEWETIKLNPDRATWGVVSTYTPSARNFAASWGVTFPCAPSQTVSNTPLESRLASLELQQNDDFPQAKSSLVSNNSQEAGGESTTSESGVNKNDKLDKKHSNYLKRIKNKARFKSANETRLVNNMPLLTVSKNKGRKKRERSEDRRKKGLVMGAAFTPVGGVLERRKYKDRDFHHR
jgi:hypothetical protein